MLSWEVSWTGKPPISVLTTSACPDERSPRRQPTSKQHRLRCPAPECGSGQFKRTLAVGQFAAEDYERGLETIREASSPTHSCAPNFSSQLSSAPSYVAA